MLISHIWNVSSVEYRAAATMIATKLIYDDFVSKHQIILGINTE